MCARRPVVLRVLFEKTAVLKRSCTTQWCNEKLLLLEVVCFPWTGKWPSSRVRFSVKY